MKVRDMRTARAARKQQEAQELRDKMLIIACNKSIIVKFDEQFKQLIAFQDANGLRGHLVKLAAVKTAIGEQPLFDDENRLAYKLGQRAEILLWEDEQSTQLAVA